MLGRRIWSDSAVRRLVRMAAAIALLVALAVALPAGATSSSKHTTSSGAIVPGFNTTSFGPNDDGSYACTGPGAGVPVGCSPSVVILPFSMNFFGQTYSSLYLNNNGNLTFGQPFSAYTPIPLSSAGMPIIAPFFADVDTRTGNAVTFGTGTVDGHAAFGVNWPGVGCYSEITSVLNEFQVLLIDRSDVAAGDFDIEFNYGQIQWDAGEASGGTSSCTNGVAARAGFSDGTGSSTNSFEIAGSGTNGAFLDSNTTTGLVHSSFNSTQFGRYVYRFRGGRPIAGSLLPLIVLPGITGSYLRSPFGEAWPRALELAASPSDSFLDNLQLADDGINPRNPSDPSYDISVWTDHGKQGIIDEIDLGCLFGRCLYRIHIYTQTFDYLQSHGYQENVNLFPFAFDWRKSAGFNASALLAKIDQVLAQTGAPKVNILAHSQGGLVAEVALKDPSSIGKVSRVLTMGTPYLGATKALGALDYAEPCLRDAFGICILGPQEAQKLVTNMPGFLDLLPSRAFYGQASPGPVLTLFDRNGDGSTDGFIDYATERSKLADRNLFLVDNSTAFHDLADAWSPADPSVRLTRLVGVGLPTIETVVEYKQPECSPSFWWLNCRLVEKSQFAFGNGDGTVPLHSADLYEPSRGFNDTGGAPNAYAAGLSHGDLATQDETLAYAVNWFAGASARSLLRSRTTASSAGITDQPTPLAGTEILVKGSVYGLLTDAAGNRLGTPDATSGVELDEIPGAVFNQAVGSGSSFVTLDGAYQGSWTTTADGQVQLVARDYASNAIAGVVAAPPISVHGGAVLKLAFSRPTNLGSLVVNVDDDGNGSVDRTIPFGTPAQGTAATDTTPPVSQVTVQNFVNGAGQAMATVTITATDETGGSGVGRIEYALDPAGTSGVYSSTLTVPATGTIIVRAIDRAGNIEAPYQVVRLSSIVTLAAGHTHSLALLKDGSVWGWGENLYGQLGNGTTTNSIVPGPVSNLSGVSAVSAGGQFSLALKSDGTVWAWGDGSRGDLGNGAISVSLTPVQVSNLGGVRSIAAGTYDHALATKTDGTVWAWGDNQFGQLGNGTTTNSSVPVKVNSLTGATGVAAGGSHSVALKSDGTVWAWGANSKGQLGNNSTKDSSTPVQVKNLSGAIAVAAGDGFSLALKSNGTVWAWGFNYLNQLGNGTSVDSKLPVQVSNLTGVTAIDAGIEHSLALKSNGTVWGWGQNYQGQLGNGTTAGTTVPVQVSNLSGASTVGAGNIFSLALKSDGTAWGWGYNQYGQLGNGTNTSASVPVQVKR